MRKNDVIEGFLVVSDPTPSGGGRSVWARATRSDRNYFLKELLDPKWPTEISAGTHASKSARRAQCLRFEERYRHITARLGAAASVSRVLVPTARFFRAGAFYYKATEWIDGPGGMPRMDDRQTAVVVRALCDGLAALHGAGVVHGDVKPSNVLLSYADSDDLYYPRLLDMDDAYLSGEPPPPEEVVGDAAFFAPEWLSYVRRCPGTGPSDLTTAVDVFALGLTLHVYLTGRVPGFDRRRFAAAAEAVLAGESLIVSADLDRRTADLLARMTGARASRPALTEVLTILGERCGPPPGRRLPLSSRLRINEGAGSSGEPLPGPPSRVRFNFSSARKEIVDDEQ